MAQPGLTSDIVWSELNSSCSRYRSLYEQIFRLPFRLRVEWVSRFMMLSAMRRIIARFSAEYPSRMRESSSTLQCERTACANRSASNSNDEMK